MRRLDRRCSGRGQGLLRHLPFELELLLQQRLILLRQLLHLGLHDCQLLLQCLNLLLLDGLPAAGFRRGHGRSRAQRRCQSNEDR